MIGGVNFQPGQQSGNTQVRPKQGNSVQEAIKILSLRLPKQVGPNALAPAALLNAQGSGGNPRIDSVVSTVMGRMFPQGQPEQPSMVAPSGGPWVSGVSGPPQDKGPQFSGDTRPPGNTPLSSMMPTAPGPRVPSFSPAEGGASPGGVMPTPALPAPPGMPQPSQKIDVTQPDREVATAPPAPTQDPWADLMNYIRRKNEAPSMMEDTPIR